MEIDLRSILLKSRIQEPDAEVLDKREKAIVEFLKLDLTSSHCLNLVRSLFRLDVPASSLDAFRNEIVQHDTDFPAKGKTYELKMMSYAAILAQMQNSSSYQELVVQLGIITSYCCGLRDKPRELDIVRIASESFQNNVAKLRGTPLSKEPNSAIASKLNEFQKISKELDASNPAEVKKMASSVHDLLRRLVKSMDQTDQTIPAINEDVRIFSWVLLENSLIMQRAWKDINPLAASLIIGKELSELVVLLPGPVLYGKIIEKLLSDNFAADQNSFTLITAVTNAPPSLIRSLVNGEEAFISDLTPVHCAMVFSLDGNSRAQIKSRLAKINIKSTKRILRSDLAIQLYRERILIRLLRDLKPSDG